MELTFSTAVPGDVAEIAALQTAVARALTGKFGGGHWSREPSEHGIRYEMRISKLWIARRDAALVATFRLATKKPWAIDRSYFTTCARPLYLTGMAVDPGLQRHGIGRRCVDEVFRIAREWPADAIRLDAYDFEGGAGGFYARCGFTEVGRVTYRKVPLVYFEATAQTDVRLRP
jgi:GNAT superfamily N-acetyltransferase